MSHLGSGLSSRHRACRTRHLVVDVGVFARPTRGVSTAVASSVVGSVNIDPPTLAGRRDSTANGGDAVSLAMISQVGGILGHRVQHPSDARACRQ
ncbi:MAG: hypothetical protein WCQ91_08995 [Planctomycetota bacterium]